MGVVVNPRGASGSGKTELVRRILAAYGWGTERPAESLHRPGRERPIAYRLRHPKGGRPLVVLGHYEVGSGGCDTIRAVDGGLGEAVRLADEAVRAGCDALLEGLGLSSEVLQSAALARRHGLHVLRLDTPLDRRVRNLILRRRAGRNRAAAIARTTAAEQRAIERACNGLEDVARVEVLDFDAALLRARELLGLDRVRAALPVRPEVAPSNATRQRLRQLGLRSA